jgi:hypothetical protein
MCKIEVRAQRTTRMCESAGSARRNSEKPKRGKKGKFKKIIIKKIIINK